MNGGDGDGGGGDGGSGGDGGGGGGAFGGVGLDGGSMTIRTKFATWVFNATTSAACSAI